VDIIATGKERYHFRANSSSGIDIAARIGRIAPRSCGSSEGFLIDRRTITTVGIVTRDRLPGLVACVESYLGNCQRHARSPEFVVADDSSSGEAADRTKAALRVVADRFKTRVLYAGRQEKSRFAARASRGVRGVAGDYPLRVFR